MRRWKLISRARCWCIFLIERCIVSCQVPWHSTSCTRFSSRLWHIYSNNSVIHGREIKTKGTNSNRGSWINKPLITGIRKFFKEINTLAFPEAPLFLRIWLTGLWATPQVSFSPSSSPWSGQSTWTPTDRAFPEHRQCLLAGYFQRVSKALVFHSQRAVLVHFPPKPHLKDTRWRWRGQKRQPVP